MSFSPNTQSWLQDAIEDFLIEKVRQSIASKSLRPDGRPSYIGVEIHSRNKDEIVLRWSFNPEPEKYYKAQDGYKVFTIAEALRSFIIYSQSDYKK